MQQNVLIDKQLWGWQLPVEEVEDSEKSEIIYVLRPDDLKIAANNKSRSRSFVLTFKSYQEAYSFDITDIEFYYTGGDGNKTVLKPGNNNITEKNIHEVIGTGEGEYQLKLTGGKTTIWVGQLLTVYQITNVQFLNNSEYDAFDWYVKIPVENELSIHFDQWNANSMNKEYVEEIGEDGKANNYWKLSPKTVTRIAKKSSSENYQMMFYSEDESVYNYILYNKIGYKNRRYSVRPHPDLCGHVRLQRHDHRQRIYWRLHRLHDACKQYGYDLCENDSGECKKADLKSAIRRDGS